MAGTLGLGFHFAHGLLPIEAPPVKYGLGEGKVAVG